LPFPHLVLHRRHRLGILRHACVGDDDRGSGRLGFESSSDLLNSLALSAFIILVSEPRQILKPVFNFPFW